MKQQLSLFLSAASLCLLFSCQKETVMAVDSNELMAVAAQSDPANKINVFKGPAIPLGNGTARTWISMNHLDQPIEIGVELTAEALAGLPGTGVHQENIVLPLHQKARAVTPFDHVGLGYNPAGHPPPGVFNVPHFDAHFYMISLEEQLAIPPVSPATLPLFQLAPPAGYMPATYFQGGPEPQMGTHWLPPPPTFLPFTRVMIYGTYNGKVTFLEPMVTRAFLESGASSSLNYLQPQKFAIAGNYPTRYNVYRDAGTGSHNITLDNFVARQAN